MRKKGEQMDTGEIQPMVGYELRPAVKHFAEAMEAELRNNDYKGGWADENCTIEYLEYRLIEEVGEYFALRAKGGIGSYFNVEPELVDIANFAMMLYQRMLGNKHLYR